MIEKSRQWSKSEIEEYLASESFFEQKIDLPYGLATEGKDLNSSAEKIFAEVSLEGKTFLDIGCGYGFFCFEAMKRGAKRVVGIDFNGEAIRKARTFSSILNLDIEFIHLDLDKEDFKQAFDLVIAIDCLHRFSDPVHVLEKLGHLTRETLIIESVDISDEYLLPYQLEGISGKPEEFRQLTGFSLEEVVELSFGATQKALVKSLPIAFVAPGVRGIHDRGNFLFTSQGLDSLLRIKMKRFTAIKSSPSPRTGFFTLFAHRRHIKKLFIIAGPTSSGKTTLIRELKEGRGDKIKESLGIPPDISIRFVEEIFLHKLQERDIECCVLHYDIVERIHSPYRTFEKDEILNILDDCDEVHIFTILTDFDRLRKQFYDSEIKGHEPTKDKHLVVQKEYASDKRLQEFYREWLLYVEEKNIPHHFISFEKGEVIIDPPSSQIFQ